MSAAVITASASLIVALLVFSLNQWAQIRQGRKLARLHRLGSQLRELYGPLNALVNINEVIWEGLRLDHLPSQIDRSPEAGTSEWQRWRDYALLPANCKMRDLIVEHADLLEGVDMPTPLRDFCAHVAALEFVVASDAEGTRQSTLIGHPGEPFVAYLRDTFSHLKREQQRLV